MNKKKYEAMESALKVIHTWASHDLLERNFQRAMNPQHVINLCEKALETK